MIELNLNDSIVYQYLAFPRPTVPLADLSQFKKQSLIVNEDDPLGLSNYSYFEHCSVDPVVLKKIEHEVDLNVLAHICMIEETSAYWLFHVAEKIESPIQRGKLLKVGSEEYEHFLLFTNLLVSTYPNYDTTSLIEKMRNFNFDMVEKDKEIEDLIMVHFLGEATIPSEMKHIYKETTNEQYRNTLRQALVQEADHMVMAKYFKEMLNQSAKNGRRKQIIYLLARLIVKAGVNIICYAQYKESFEKYRINYENIVDDIRKSRRSKDSVTSSIEGLFQLAKLLDFADDDFDKFLHQCKITDTYKYYI